MIDLVIIQYDRNLKLMVLRDHLIWDMHLGEILSELNI